MGIGIGGDYPLSAVIASEFSATKIRGRLMCAVFAAQGWGNFSTYPNHAKKRPASILIPPSLFPQPLLWSPLSSSPHSRTPSCTTTRPSYVTSTSCGVSSSASAVSPPASRSTSVSRSQRPRVSPWISRGTSSRPRRTSRTSSRAAHTSSTPMRLSSAPRHQRPADATLRHISRSGRTSRF